MIRAARVRPTRLEASGQWHTARLGERPQLALVPPPPPARYGAEARPKYLLIAILAAVHAAIFAALCLFDVVQLAPPPKAPTVITLLPDMAPPPPAAAPTPRHATEAKPVAAAVVAPPPLVAVPASPSPVATIAAPAAPTAVPAPAAPTAAAPVQLAATPPAPAAPITPPDFSARQLNNPGPRYPPDSSRAHEAGTVKLKVLVSPKGRADEISVANSSGFARLDRAALECVKRWRFLPAEQAGAAVSAWVIVPVTFRRPD